MSIITWQNIRPTVLSDGVIQPLAVAQQGMNSAFDNFNRTIQAQQEANQGVLDRTKAGNLEDFYAKVRQQYATPEAAAAALKDGSMQALIDGYGANGINKAEARKFMETLPQTLRERLTQEQAYTDQQNDRIMRPVVDRIKMLAATDPTMDPKAAAENIKQARFLTETYQPYGLRNAGQLAAEITKDEQSGIKFGQDTESHKSTMATQNLARQNATEQLKQSKMHTADMEDAHAVTELLSNAQNAVKGKEMTNGMPTPSLLENAVNAFAGKDVPARIKAKAIEQARAADLAVKTNFDTWSKANGRIGPESIEGGAGATDALNAALTNVKDPDDASRIKANLAEVIKEGVTLKKGTKLADGTVLDSDLTIRPSGNAIRQVVTGADGYWWAPKNWGIGGDAKSQLIELMKTPEYIQEYAQRLQSDERNKFMSALKPSQPVQLPRSMMGPHR